MLEKYDPSTVEYYEAIKAMKPEELRREWQEITLENYWYWMECVPPRAMKGHAFLVGECMTHTKDGAIYQAVTCVLIDDEAHYYTRPALLQSFNPETYAEEIRAQFKI